MFTDNENVRLIFGLKLKTLRQQQGLSYQQLSDATGIAISYLHDIENGKKYPKADKIIAIAKALKVDYDYLVSLTANKRLQPIIDLMNSDFTRSIPWEHFGITPFALLELFSNTPDKITAFISTILKLTRSVQIDTRNFYTSALRSYQEINDNYFEDIEIACKSFRETFALQQEVPIRLETLEKILKDEFEIQVDRKQMASKEILNSLRSYFVEEKKILFINKGLSIAQEKFLLAREIAYHRLQLYPRNFETIIQDWNSFETLLNNYKASYFACALLIPEDIFTEDVKQLFSASKFDGQDWLNLVQQYDVTAEMLLQRFTNVLPAQFGIDNLFFIRMRADVEKDTFDITKELHLSQLHTPHANLLHEHYCRRWLAIGTMKDTYKKTSSKKYKQPEVSAQISEYWKTHNRYLSITISQPQSKTSKKINSVTLGLLIDAKLQRGMPISNDLSIPVKTVHTTCERCDIEDCKERVAEPIFITRILHREKVEEALIKLKQ